MFQGFGKKLTGNNVVFTGTYNNGHIQNGTMFDFPKTGLLLEKRERKNLKFYGTFLPDFKPHEGTLCFTRKDSNTDSTIHC
jgi:hypothetical protein